MNKSFLANLLLLLSINIVIKPVFIFGIDRNVQNLVGEHDYGLYFTFLTFTMIMQVLGDAGLQNYNNQQISSGNVSFSNFFPSVMAAKLLVSILYVLLVMGGGYLLGYQADYNLLMWVMLGQLLSGILLLLRTNVSGSGHYRTDSIFSAIDRLLMIAFCGYYLWSQVRQSDFTILLFAKLQLISYSIAILIVLGWIIFKLPTTHVRIKHIATIPILKKSFPYAIVVLLMIIYSRSDIILLKNMLEDGSKEAGIYAAGYRLLDAMNMVGFLAGSLLLPMFARLMNDKKQTEELFILSLKILLLFTVIVAVTVISFRTQIMQLLYVNATEYWGNVLGLLMVSFVSMTLSYVSGTYLTASGKVRHLIGSFLVAIIINLVLNLILIPRNKVEGVAVASAVTQLFILIVQMNKSMKYAGIRISKDYLVKFGVFLFMFLAISLLAGKILTINWYYQLIITPIFGLLLAWLFKILPEELLNVVNGRKFLNRHFHQN